MELVMLLVVNLIASDATTYNANTDDSSFVTASADQALRSIKNAEASGINTVPLIEKFNVAIDLLHQAEYQDYRSCYSHDDCTFQANTMLLSIVEEASSLANQKTGQKEQVTTMTFTVYLPSVSFVIAIALVLFYRIWKSRKLKRFQTMNIRETRNYDD